MIAPAFAAVYCRRMTRLFLIIGAVALAACARGPEDAVPEAPSALDEALVRPKVRPAGLGRSVPKDARTVEQFDVTTAQERAAATAVPAAAREERLGVTVASLGDPGQAGFWIKTPLAKAEGKGRVVFPGTGKSVQVDLIPIEGAATAGSRLSLAAFRLIGAPLTGLPEVEVFAGSAGGS